MACYTLFVLNKNMVCNKPAPSRQNLHAHEEKCHDEKLFSSRKSHIL